MTLPSGRWRREVDGRGNSDFTDKRVGFDTFQRTAINNTMNYLRERNQLVGTSTEPLTKFFPPEFAGIPCC